MVYYVVSDDSLSNEELINVLCEINVLHPENVSEPSETYVISMDDMPQHTWSAEDEYYVQLMERNYEEDPYEYLVMTLAEVRQILKLQAELNCNRAVMRKLHAE